MSVVLSFHGASGTVTGSCYRVTHPGGQFLVDCGLFQGNKAVRALNDKPFPFDPQKQDFVLLTHAHIDHAGLLPKLIKHKFEGPIHGTEPTTGLMDYLLPDSAGIQEYEAERQNRKRARKGEPLIEPLYTKEHAEKAISRSKGHAYEEWFEPGPGVKARFWNAGHILGSASIEVHVQDEDGKTIKMLFSGDLGPDEKVFYLEPHAPSGFDYILCESTYGGRERDDYSLEERRAALKKEINEALARGGNLVIPAFAVERSQELLHDIGVLIKRGEIDPQLVFLDSPLARRVTNVFKRHAADLQDVELEPEELFDDDRFRIVESVEESKAINRIHGGAIIMSASGMCDAGRIKHHLRNNISDPKSTILFVGYQAPGTLGHVIKSGKSEVRIHGNNHYVRAAIRSIGNYSAHGDHTELMDWIAERLPAHGAIFLTHGEDESRDAMKKALAEKGLGPDKVIAPQLDDQFELRANGVGDVHQPETMRIDPQQFTQDWSAEYARFSIELGNILTKEQSDKKRLELMKRLRAELKKI
ncbi:MBL fold metallo-hydrolase [Maritalea mediterranea]|uniref:MBL fold metallo-hydrolase n=1 Tax=Maritalea mediterranea TaxID=2909667 RepID=A0ABS9E2G0_9HYPH|nr:MBL fold metallo-hydrolase [Maritalea mediterranea]MCF4097047.1 MBL fold metallo-hydrolase [Maritalea mediterranea]